LDLYEWLSVIARSFYIIKWEFYILIGKVCGVVRQVSEKEF
jgi:hypothetical protein